MDHGESAKENIRRAFDSVPATTRQEESGSRLQRARERVDAFLQFLFRPFRNERLWDCVCGLAEWQSLGTAVTLCTHYRYSDSLRCALSADKGALSVQIAGVRVQSLYTVPSDASRGERSNAPVELQFE